MFRIALFQESDKKIRCFSGGSSTTGYFTLSDGGIYPSPLFVCLITLVVHLDEFHPVTIFMVCIYHTQPALHTRSLEGFAGEFFQLENLYFFAPEFPELNYAPVVDALQTVKLDGILNNCNKASC